MNDLDIVFDEPASRDRPRRHRRAAPKKRRRGRGKTATALLVVLLLLGGLGGGAWYGVDKLRKYLETPDYTTGGTGSVTVEITQGQNLTDIADTLYAQDVVKSPKAFVEATKADPLSRHIQPGFYELRRQMRAADALALLLDPASRLVNAVTIPEGRTAIQVYTLLSKALDIPAKEFAELAEDPIALGVPDWWFTRNDGKESTVSIEGFLFPDTYEFGPDATAESVLHTMVQRFLDVTGELDFAERVEKERKISPYEALIVASLAQAEAGTAEDLGKVARVAYNRVYGGQFPCGCLQFDVTVNYWLELNGRPTKSSAEMTVEELTDPGNPYNRNVEGLVPTPINNPGELALKGAMDPPDEDWLYFVAVDEDGNSAFSSTWEQFCTDVQKAVEAGILTGTC